MCFLLFVLLFNLLEADKYGGTKLAFLAVFWHLGRAEILELWAATVVFLTVGRVMAPRNIGDA